MARKALIQRQKKRQLLYAKYYIKRKFIKSKITSTKKLEQKLDWHLKLQNLPKNSSRVRLHNRCLITGRPKGFFRFFGLSRHLIREFAHQGFFPGVVKSSW
uniref:Small ribosomal subunit protein uS14c n=1 Tax=Bryopsis sp. HV04063 TaxID=1979421 RepID=A0A2P0QIT7_9CHLO|nr:ribosomal protein S14 [Bryopsis sp. HV04063]ARO74129.1 ribosomal protein S14 [Bryopsis sp. HV04063]